MLCMASVRVMAVYQSPRVALKISSTSSFDKFLADFFAEAVLHVGQHQRGVEIAVGAECLVDVFLVVLVVYVFHTHAYRETRFRSVGVFRHSLRSERIAGDFALEFEVGGAVGCLQARVARDIVEQFVLEHLL